MLKQALMKDCVYRKLWLKLRTRKSDKRN